MSQLVPMVTEKAYAGAAQRLYTFKVPTAMSKPQVAREVETAFGVKVVTVRTLRQPGKTRLRQGRYRGRKPGFKKAVVQLKEGDKIEELAGGGEAS